MRRIEKPIMVQMAGVRLQLSSGICLRAEIGLQFALSFVFVYACDNASGKVLMQWAYDDRSCLSLFEQIISKKMKFLRLPTMIASSSCAVHVQTIPPHCTLTWYTSSSCLVSSENLPVLRSMASGLRRVWIVLKSGRQSNFLRELCASRNHFKSDYISVHFH